MRHDIFGLEPIVRVVWGSLSVLNHEGIILGSNQPRKHQAGLNDTFNTQLHLTLFFASSWGQTLSRLTTNGKQ